MSAPLNINQHSTAGVIVLELSGQLVADEGDQAFKDHVEALVREGSRHVLLDLRDVTYMDSGGAGALVAVYLHVMRREGRLKLLRPSDRVCRVLQITHLLSVFEVFADEEQAIRSFALPSPATTGPRLADSPPSSPSSSQILPN
jgi:anti-sigma B factor antagonist